MTSAFKCALLWGVGGVGLDLFPAPRERARARETDLG